MGESRNRFSMDADFSHGRFWCDRALRYHDVVLLVLSEASIGHGGRAAHTTVLLACTTGETLYASQR